MISAVECREHAIECRQMSERAPNLRVRDILIDMARAWERLALETEHNAPATSKDVCAIDFDGSCRPGRRRRPTGHVAAAPISPVIRVRSHDAA